MIQKAMQEVVKMSAPNYKELNGKTYSDKDMKEIKPEPGPIPSIMGINTLSGVVDYIKNNLDNESDYVIHISDYNKVMLYGKYDPEFCRRKLYISAKSELVRFSYGRFEDIENFIINLMSYFQPSEKHTDLLKYVSSLTSDSSITIDDDGITQNATVKTGIVNKEIKAVPNPVELIPFETFPEIEGIVRKFVFRISQRSGVNAALFESGDTKWKIEYIQLIKKYFDEQLKDEAKHISIIA